MRPTVHGGHLIPPAMRHWTLSWTGVRNRQARDFMRDVKRPGDGLPAHHSYTRERMTRLLALREMRQSAELATMRVLQPGNRLSITPVSDAEWRAVLARLAR